MNLPQIHTQRPALTPYTPPPSLDRPHAPVWEQLSDSARERLWKSTPAETRKAYEREWKRFAQWSAAHGRSPLPCTAADILEWVSQRCDARHHPNTIGQGIAAVRHVHDFFGYEEHPPTKKAWRMVRAHRRELLDTGWRPTKSATVTTEQFRAMVAALPADKPSGVRDRAILAVGLSGFFRRSNIIRLNLGDVVETERGDVCLDVVYSKTDQAAQGTTRVLPPGSHPDSDPVSLLTSWLALLGQQGITDGPLWRPVSKTGRILDRRINPDWVRIVVRDAAAAAGLKSLKARPYRAHTLRSSGVTIARRAGVPWSLICEQGDWSPKSTVVLGYEQPEERDNAMRGVL